jgi:catalase
MANILVNIHPDLAARVAEKTGLDIAECLKVAPKPLVTEIGDSAMPSGKKKVAASPALSMAKPLDGIKGCKVAVLAGEGVDGDQLGKLKAALAGQGAVVEVIAERGGTITCSQGKAIKVDRPAPNAPSVIYDAVIVPGGASAAKLAKTGVALAFLAEAFKHGKPLAFIGDAAALIGAAHLPIPANGAPDQGVATGDTKKAVQALIAGLKQHRFHNRDIDAVAA